MGITTGFLAVACLLAATFEGAVAASRLTIEPSGPKTVFPGENVTIICRSDAPITYCRFTVPNSPVGLNLSPKTKPTREYAYYGNGLQEGQCGIVLYSISDRYNGKFECSVARETEAQEIAASSVITVTRTPKPPELIVSPSYTSRGSNDYREGDILQASCVVRDARPAAEITWYLGDEVITSGVRNIPEFDKEQNLFTTRQNLTRKLSWKDSSRELRCVVSHPALGPKNQTGKTFNVRYPPRDIQMPIEQFGFTLGETGRVVVEVLANPQPILTWMIGDLLLTEGERDKSGRFEAAQGEFIAGGNDSDVYSQGQGKWRAVLYIYQVTNGDTKVDYYLRAKNSEGEKKYRVTISTLTEPQALLLDYGGIIGIVAAVLILVLIIILVIFARVTGRWCFAGGVPKHDPRESSDTESAENGTLEKKKKNKPMTAFFKKKNDKVAADQDEVKTVPMEDEKFMLQDMKEDSEEGKKDIVYAELDLQLNRSPVIIREDDKTEYAEILHAVAKQENSP